MPDESPPTSEHALLQEVTAPLATLPDDAVPEVSEVDFPVALRGYDRLAVDAYVKRTSQLVAELQATRSPEAAVRRGLERVGEEVSGILQRAHEAASQITARSRSDAEDRLERSRQEARAITADAERRLRELDAETDRIWAERQRIVEDAQQLAHQLLSLASSAAERFPAADDPETTQGDSPRPVLAASSDAEGEHGSNGLVEDPALQGDSDELSVADEPFEDPDDAGSTRIMPPITPSESVPPPEATSAEEDEAG